MTYIVVFDDPHPSLLDRVYGPFPTEEKAKDWTNTLPKSDAFVSWEIWPVRAPR